MIDTLIRTFAPKWAERRRISGLAKQSRPRAYQDAFEVCSTAGPVKVAESLGTARDVSDRAIAHAYANSAYRSEVFESAFQGAVDGFAAYDESRTTNP